VVVNQRNLGVLEALLKPCARYVVSRHFRRLASRPALSVANASGPSEAVRGLMSAMHRDCVRRRESGQA